MTQLTAWRRLKESAEMNTSLARQYVIDGRQDKLDTLNEIKSKEEELNQLQSEVCAVTQWRI